MLTDQPRFSPENESISIRLDRIQQKIAKAAEKSGRNASSICLVGVTKTVSAAKINEALLCGLTNVAESKIQEAQQKRNDLHPVKPITHHLIGHLQTNKARKACELFDVVQTIDRPRLAETLNRIGGEMAKKITTLVEIKLADEPTKTGLLLSDADTFIQQFSRYTHLSLQGLMTIAPLGITESETRDAFRLLRKFWEKNRPYFSDDPILSMGMSDDFEAAIEEGSTMVRVGRAIFGDR